MVFLVDDEPIVRRAFGRILGVHGFEVEAFASGASFLDRLPHHGPACVLLDFKLPGLSGLDVQGALASRDDCAGLVVVLVTAHGDIPMSVRAMRAGAFDVLTKPVEPALLVATVGRALLEAADRHTTASEHVTFRARVAQLTRRERQVCALVLSGYLNKQVAADLAIAEKTVKLHRASAMRRLGVSSVAELARLVERTGTAPALSAALPAPSSHGASPPTSQ